MFNKIQKELQICIQITGVSCVVSKRYNVHNYLYDKQKCMG